MLLQLAVQDIGQLPYLSASSPYASVTVDHRARARLKIHGVFLVP
jgi:hypothetical protein